MGRIKTTLIKRTAKKLMSDSSDRFTDKFDDNKKSVTESLNVDSKKLRNTIAGYMTKLKRRENIV